MDCRDSTSSRPDELDRLREEARLKRACQAQVLTRDPELTKATGFGDGSVFVKVAIPSEEQDNIGRLAREILEPYFNFLTSTASLSSPYSSSASKAGRTINTGPGSSKPQSEAVKGSSASISRAPGKGEDEGGGKSGRGPGGQNQVLDTGQHKSNNSNAVSASKGAFVANAHSNSNASERNSKRPSSLPTSQQNQLSSSGRTSRAHLLPTPPGFPPSSTPSTLPFSNSSSTTSSQQSALTVSASSPGAPVLSPCNQKDIISSAPTRDANSRDRSTPSKSKDPTQSPLSDHSKHRKPVPSPIKDLSKSRPGSLQLASLTLSSTTMSKDRLQSPSKGKDGLPRPSSSSRQASPLVQSSSSLSGSHQKHSTSPSLPSRSSTPTKSGSRPPNGITSCAGASLSKSLQSSLNADQKDTKSVSNGPVDNKTKPLKLQMPETKKITSKSDLDSIFKEWEPAAPHTAIETPQKAGDRFPFPSASYLATATAASTRDRLSSKSEQYDKKTLWGSNHVDVKGDNSGKNEVAPATSSSSTSLTTPAPGKKESGSSPSTTNTTNTTSKPVTAAGDAIIKPTTDSNSSGHVNRISAGRTKSDKQQQHLPQSTITTVTVTTTTTLAGTASTSTTATMSGTATTTISTCSTSSNGDINKAKKPGSKTIGKRMTDIVQESVLAKDLSLSEDSEAEQTSEDNKTSASQSKKGKVIGPSGGAPVKRERSRSSSSNSSSDSSSDNEDKRGKSAVNDDEDDDGDEEKNDSSGRQGKAIDNRLSSSSSESASDSGSDSANDDEEEEDNDKDASKSDAEESLGVGEHGEKTPSSPHSKTGGGPASVGTPGSSVVQENEEPSWGLENFMNKKNTNSPANVSPLKSPDSIHSAPPSVKSKEESVCKTPDTGRPKSIKDIGPSTTLPFDLGATHNSSMDSHDDNHSADEAGSEDSDDESEDDDEQDEKVRRKKKRKKLELLKTSKSPSARDEQPESSPLSGNAKTSESSKKKSVTERPSDLKLAASTSSPEKGLRQKHSSKLVGRGQNLDKKKSGRGLGSNSEDEIDVVSVTPDVKAKQRLMPSPEELDIRQDKSKQEASKNLFKSPVGDSSDEEQEVKSNSQSPVPRGKNASARDIKRHRWKHKTATSSPHSPQLSSISLSHTPTMTDKMARMIKSFPSDSDAAATLDHLESIAKPPNILSPLHPAFSPPQGAPVSSAINSFSSKQRLPSFIKSFSPAPQPGGAAEPLPVSSLPPIISKLNEDGTSQPQITVRIPIWRLPEPSLSWLRDKRRQMKCRASSSSKLSPTDKVKKEGPQSDGSQALPTPVDSKNSRVPPISDPKLSPSGTSTDISKERTSMLLPPSSYSSIPNSDKRKLSESNFTSSSPSSNSISSHKIPKSSEHPKKEAQGLSNSVHESSPTSGSSDLSSLAVKKSSKHTTAQSPTFSKPGNLSSSSAVKNLDFSHTNSDQQHSESNVEPASSLDTKHSKASKRKGESTEEQPNKKNKTDSILASSDKTNHAAALTVKRKDSNGSTSSRSSHKSSSSAPPGFSLSASSNAAADRKVAGKLGNSEKVTNGPVSSSLPFNHYVNGDVNRNANNATGSAGKSKLLSLPSALAPSLSYPSHLPQPAPVETETLSSDEHNDEARKHKKAADNMVEKSGSWFETYLRSGISFLLNCDALKRERKPDTNNCYTMYHGTAQMLKHVIHKWQSRSSNNPVTDRERENLDKERKMVVMIIRLSAYLFHGLFRMRKNEAFRLNKEIEDTKVYNHHTTANTGNPAMSSRDRPHAPSPHQTSTTWNKGSTGTPSPKSPTPSPAGSVSSQGSASEHIQGKLPNGSIASSASSLASPSPGMNHRNNKQVQLTKHLIKAMELWDMADNETRPVKGFFNLVDSACGPLSFHSEPQVVARYMKHALLLLNL